MKTAGFTAMDYVVLRLIPPNGAIDAGLTLTYKFVMSYVAKVNKVKTTFYCTLNVDAGGNLLSIDQGVKGDKSARNGGFKTATDGFPGIDNLDTEQVDFDCLQITGLPFAGTKYSFALTTVATDINGNVWTSAVGKASASTLKYKSPTLPKGQKALPDNNSFSVIASTAPNKPDDDVSYEVGVYDTVAKTYRFGDDIKTIVGVPGGFKIVSTDNGVIVYEGAAAKMVLGVFEVSGAIKSNVLKVKVK